MNLEKCIKLCCSNRYWKICTAWSRTPKTRTKPYCARLSWRYHPSESYPSITKKFWNPLIWPSSSRTLRTASTKRPSNSIKTSSKCSTITCASLDAPLTLAYPLLDYENFISVAKPTLLIPSPKPRDCHRRMRSYHREDQLLGRKM